MAFGELLTFRHGQAREKLLEEVERERPRIRGWWWQREKAHPAEVGGPCHPALRPITRSALRNCPGPAARSFVNLESGFTSTAEMKPRVQESEKYMGGDEFQAAPLAQPFKESNKQGRAVM